MIFLFGVFLSFLERRFHFFFFGIVELEFGSEIWFFYSLVLFGGKKKFYLYFESHLLKKKNQLLLTIGK